MSQPISDGRARRVLFVSNDPPGRAVYRYRCENLALALRAAGWLVDIAWVEDRRVRVDHDIVVLHRICATPEGRAYAAAARRCGAALVYGADDLVFEESALDPSDPSQQRARRYAGLHAQMLREADAVIVSTEFLAEKARASKRNGAPVYVLRNFLSPALLELSAAAARAAKPAAKRAVTLGYLSGTPTHDADLAVIAPCLAEVIGGAPDTELLLAGPISAPVALETALGARLKRLPFVDWQDLPTLLARIDINLAPLDLSRAMNHGKSEIKLLEAAAVGVPTVAAASAGFCEALAPQPSGGTLARDAEDWRHALQRFLESEMARREAGLAARSFLERNGTLAANAHRVQEAIAEIAALPRTIPLAPRASVVGSPLAPRYLAKAVLRARAPVSGA